MGYIYAGKNNLQRYALTRENLLLLARENKWIEVSFPTQEELDLLQSILKIHPLTIEDIRGQNTRTKVETFKNYATIVIQDLVRENDEIKPVEIDLIVGQKFLITAYNHSITEIERLKINKKKMQRLLNEGIDSLMYFMMDTVIKHYVPFVDEITESIDEVETALAKHFEKKLLNKIISLRTDVILIKKIITPQREKIRDLSKGVFGIITPETQPYFRDLHDTTVRVSEAVDNGNTEISAVYDTYMSLMTYNSNEVMKMLSVVATIILPLTFITGIFGMNFDVIPGLHSAVGFWITIGSMVLLAVVMIYLFKRQQIL